MNELNGIRFVNGAITVDTKKGNEKPVYKTQQAGKAKVKHTSRVGRFKVSVLVLQMTKSVPDTDAIPEYAYEKSRACVGYGIKSRKTGEWQNQNIWCYPSELVKLRDALNEVIKQQEEALASPSSEV